MCGGDFSVVFFFAAHPWATMKKSILKGEKFYPALQTILFPTHCSSSINNTNKYLI